MPLQLQAEDLQAGLLTTAERLVLLAGLLGQPVAGQRLHRLLLVVDAATDDVHAGAAAELRPVVHLGEHADRRARPEVDGAVVGGDGAGQGGQQVGLPGAVGADQAEPLAEVDLVTERQEQVAHADVEHLHHPPGGVRPTQAHLDLLVRHGRGRRADGHELLPPGLRGVGLGGVLEVLRGPLLHDLHVVEEAALLVVPALQGVAQQFLAAGPSLRERGVGAAVHPRARPLDHHHLRGDALQQGAVVADHQDRAAARLQLVLQPQPGGDVEVVVRLVEQQDVRPAVQQQVQHQALALAPAELADQAGGEVLHVGLHAALGGRSPLGLQLVPAEVAPVGERFGEAGAVVLA